MDEDKTIRKHLISLLEGGNAHIKFGDAVKRFRIGDINRKPGNLPYSAWHLVEHMRITQYDILDFVRNPDYKYMNWPDDYWPPKSRKASKNDWEKSIGSFRHNSNELKKIVNNPKTDLYSKIKHGEGQTVLREMLLVADHNAYHLGELVVLARLVGAMK